MIRLVPDQSGLIRRTDVIEFTFDGRPVAAHQGETILGALTRSGTKHLRDAPEDGAPCGAFCCMGLCQECLVKVDGARVESCRHIATDGLEVHSLKRGRND